jgi:hypothetical protein
VAARGVPSRKLRAAFAVAPLCAGPFLFGCTDSYAGISLVPGAADPEIQAIARDARAGDKRAQLRIGILYEEGVKLPRDESRAEALYASAAAPSGATLYVYTPPVGRSDSGRVVALPHGSKRPGLMEAAVRLQQLRCRRDRHRPRPRQECL